MTIQEVIDWFNNNNYFVLAYFLSIIVVSLLVHFTLTQNNVKQLKYIMSVLIYTVTIPGILCVILLLYTLFFLNGNLLNVNLTSYFLPIISMVLTFIILNKKVHLKDIPGFGKISALMVITFVTFVVIFVLQRSHFGLFFIGGFTQLIGVFIVLFIILKLVWARLMK